MRRARAPRAVTLLTPAALRRMPLPWPDGETDKDSRGRVLVAGASALSPGAVMLSGLAALRAGAGKVRVAVPRSLAAALGFALPEAGILAFHETRRGAPARAAIRQVGDAAGDVDAALIGPGLDDERGARALVQGVLERVHGPGFVIDALGLTGLWQSRGLLARHAGRLVITPHAGEMAKLCGLPKDAVLADPPGVARRAAEHLGCIVVLKGADTVIVQPDGRGWLHRAGVVGLATAGSGDVLAGLMAGLIARGAPVLHAAAWAVVLHARAGRTLTRSVGPLGFLASELLAELPGLLSGAAVRPAAAKPRPARTRASAHRPIRSPTREPAHRPPACRTATPRPAAA